MSPANSERVKGAKKTWMGTRLFMIYGREGLPGADSGQQVQCSCHLRLVAGNARFVDVVDLVLIEEFLRVAQVDLLAHEDVEEVRIDVCCLAHLAEDQQRLGKRHAAPVSSDPCGVRLDDV